jgi:tol-pal system protein YbgF
MMNGWVASRAVLAVTVGATVLTGCLAQQADLTQMERTLGGKITRLDQREKELQAAIKQAKDEIDRLVSETRARMSHEITVLRDEDLPSIRGALDKEAHQTVSLRARLEDLEDRTAKRLATLAAAEQERKTALQHEKEQRERLQQELSQLNARLDAMPGTIGTMVKTLGTRLDEQDKALRTGETRNATVTHQLESQGRTVSEQVVQLSRALSDFKQALQGLNEKVAQEQQAANQLTKRMDTLQTKVDADAKATSAHLAEVNKSVSSVAKAVETVGSRFVTRLDEQDHRLEQARNSIQAVTTQINALTQTINQLQEARETRKGSTGDRAHKPAAATEVAGHSRESASETPRSAQLLQDGPAPSGPVSTAMTHDSQGDGRETSKEAYEDSLKKFREGDLDGARQGFTEFLAAHPTSGLAANAQYWVGECYYGKKEYERAIEAFDRVKHDYPRSEKVPAALLKTGFAYLALKDHKRATTVLRQVMDGYPRSVEAGKAAEKLAQLRAR